MYLRFYYTKKGDKLVCHSYMDVGRRHGILESNTEDFITHGMANDDIHDHTGTLAPNSQRDLCSDTGRYCTCNKFVFCYS